MRLSQFPGERFFLCYFCVPWKSPVHKPYFYGKYLIFDLYFAFKHINLKEKLFNYAYCSVDSLEFCHLSVTLVQKLKISEIFERRQRDRELRNCEENGSEVKSVARRLGFSDHFPAKRFFFVSVPRFFVPFPFLCMRGSFRKRLQKIPN